MRKFFYLVFLIVFLIGCDRLDVEKIDDFEITDEAVDIKDNIIKVNSDINSFRFRSLNNLVMESPEESIEMGLNIAGSMDRSEKKIELIGEMNMPDMSVPIETYSDGFWIYTKNMAQWLKMELEDSEIFDMQDQMKYLIDFLKESKFSYEEVSKDEKNFYKLIVVPNDDALFDLAEKNSPIPLEGLDLMKDLFRKLEVVYYVERETFFLESAEIFYEMVFDDFVMKNEMYFETYDFNNVQDIIIPEDAKAAMDVVDFQNQMMEEFIFDEDDYLLDDEDFEFEDYEDILEMDE
jgi:hypothetical protein